MESINFFRNWMQQPSTQKRNKFWDKYNPFDGPLHPDPLVWQMKKLIHFDWWKEELARRENYIHGIGNQGGMSAERILEYKKYLQCPTRKDSFSTVKSSLA